MDKKIPILIIGAAGCGVSEGVIKALKLAGYGRISILEYSEESAHIYRADKFIITKINPDSPDFVNNLIEICKKHSIKVVIPGSTWETLPISKRYNDFVQNGIFPLVNNFNLVNVCNNKWETFKFLKANNIGTPVTIYPFNEHMDISEFGLLFPVIVKPAVGRGSQNIFVAKSKDELNLLAKYLYIKKIDFVVQEYIGSNDDEYTIGIISDKNANVIDSLVMKRKLGGGGASISAEVCKRSVINEFCEKTAALLKSTGPCNIQLRLDKNEPKIFEINPRFSGSVPMRAIAGFNEPDMLLRNFVFDEALSNPEISESLKFFRVFQELYFDKTTVNPKAEIKNYI